MPPKKKDVKINDKKKQSNNDKKKQSNNDKKKSGKKEKPNKKDDNEEKKEYIKSRQNTTSIAMLTNTDNIMTLSIRDQRNVVSLQTTMKNVFSNGMLPQDRCDINCWWCRHTFDTCPIGLPIRRHDSQKVLGYTPEIYETDGVFCSFPCALAYCFDQGQSSMHKDSPALLHEIYYKYYGNYTKINQANTWKVLKGWGGDVSIANYRNTLGDKMIVTRNIASLVRLIPMGQFIEVM